jgi:hypothetical protein
MAWTKIYNKGTSNITERLISNLNILFVNNHYQKLYWYEKNTFWKRFLSEVKECHLVYLLAVTKPVG